VTAYDAGGTALSTSEQRLFYTAYGPPAGAPEPSYPIGGYVIQVSSYPCLPTGSDHPCPEIEQDFVWGPWDQRRVLAVQPQTDSLFAFRIQLGLDPLLEGPLVWDEALRCDPHGPAFCQPNSYALSPPIPHSTTYYWRMRQENRAGAGPWTSIEAFTLTPPVSTEAGAMPTAPLAIEAAFPAPARGRFTVAYTLSAPSEVELALYDVLGAVVHRQALGPGGGGRHEVAVSLPPLAAGPYLLRLRTPEGTATRRITLLR